MTTSSASLLVPADHPALPGHFPGQPLVPGVVLLGLVLDRARALLGFRNGANQWRRVKFLRPVLPDQACELELVGTEEAFSFLIRSEDGLIMARGRCQHAPLA